MKRTLLTVCTSVLVGVTFCCAPGCGTGGPERSPVSGKMRPQTEAKHPIRVLIVGDSTVATGLSENGVRGWGQMLPEFFTEEVVVINRARGGRSSGSFIKEGLWAKALEDAPDYVLIQFGHNDCPGKGERYSDPNTTFQEHLRTYITDARAVGAIPILITPMTRRNYRTDGHIRTILRPYAEAMIKVGHETGVDVIDLHAASVSLFERLGEAGSSDLSANGGRDRTHHSEKGARMMARMIVERLPEGELKACVKMPLHSR